MFCKQKTQENRPVEESVSMNTTANVGSNFRSCRSSLISQEALKIEHMVAFSLILVVSLVGNSLIVLIVYKKPTLRKPINMLIANMAIPTCSIQYSGFLLVWQKVTLARGLLVVPLVRPCAKYMFFFQTFPR